MKNSELTPEEIYKYALRVAQRYGMHQEAEDIAQRVVEIRLSKPENNQHIVHSVVDAIRAEGFNTSPDRPLGLNRRHIPTEFLPENTEPEPDKIYSFELDTMIGSLKGQDRVVFVLYYKWGFNAVEVAEALGITPARVGQLLVPLTEYLKCRFAKGHTPTPNQTIPS